MISILEIRRKDSREEKNFHLYCSKRLRFTRYLFYCRFFWLFMARRRKEGKKLWMDDSLYGFRVSFGGGGDVKICVCVFSWKIIWFKFWKSCDMFWDFCPSKLSSLFINVYRNISNKGHKYNLNSLPIKRNRRHFSSHSFDQRIEIFSRKFLDSIHDSKVSRYLEIFLKWVKVLQRH